MKIKRSLTLAAVFVSGLAAGAAGMAWQAQRQWSQWFMDFNVSPLLEEVTYGIQELRRGNGATLQATLEETAWRSIGLLSKQLENGEAMPAQAMKALQYHCEHDQRRADAADSPQAAGRAKACAALLTYYARRT